jgi:hypothetical protein
MSASIGNSKGFLDTVQSGTTGNLFSPQPAKPQPFKSRFDSQRTMPGGPLLPSNPYLEQRRRRGFLK